MGLIEVLDPTGRTRAGELPLAARIGDLHARKVAFFDNGKWNAGALLNDLARAIGERVSDLKAVYCEHDNLDHYAADAESTAYIEALAEYDAVVIGVGD